MNFESIEYLKTGTVRQQQAYSVLTKHRILEKLTHFSPVLTGTIPINIDIESSDLDVICCFTDQNEFIHTITEHFKQEKNFQLKENDKLNAVVANFTLNGFEIEIFGQSIPTKQQRAYRHMIVEYNLLKKHGEAFRQQIIQLKQQGHKTEPAFAIVLGLNGDPYEELLKFENDLPDKQTEIKREDVILKLKKYCSDLDKESGWWIFKNYIVQFDKTYLQKQYNRTANLPLPEHLSINQTVIINKTGILYKSALYNWNEIVETIIKTKIISTNNANEHYERHYFLIFASTDGNIYDVEIKNFDKYCNQLGNFIEQYKQQFFQQ